MFLSVSPLRPVGLAVLCAASLALGANASEHTTPASARFATAMQVVPGQLNPFESSPGGKATLRRRVAPRKVFEQPIPTLGQAQQMDFVLGRALFEKLWVQAPSSTRASDGLGPLYNARSCAMCHPGNGRGRAPEADGVLPASLLLRLSVHGGGTHGIQDYLATMPDPQYGGQLQTDAALGLSPEGQPTVRYREHTIALPGETVTLRAPSYNPGAPLSPETMISPRLASSLQGMGLIAEIAAQDILAAADPEDHDQDGISGRANYVPSRDTGQPELGRFGWKAGIATLREQVADAFAHDIGISSPLFPDPWGDCTQAQAACRAAPHGDKDARETEIDATGLDLTTAYVAGLALPARTEAAQNLAGRDLFHDIGCAACHTPAFVTGQRTGDPTHNAQVIWPYSDFLLHDMGDGLADNRPEHRATGREWRTPPLWGIGKVKQVLGTQFFLHDGRARSLSEAILWHAGEAQPARDRFSQLEKPDRDALVSFLESL